MRLSLIAAAFAAVLSTSAIAAEGYNGQVQYDKNGRHEIIIVKAGDSIWNLCMRHDWCRLYYPGNRKDWPDFLSWVTGLNGGKDMNRLAIGEQIKFPLPFGTAAALDVQDRMIAGLQARAKVLASKNAEQMSFIARFETEVKSLKDQVQVLLGLNKKLTADNVQLKRANDGLYDNLSILREDRDSRWTTAWVLGFMLLFFVLGSLVAGRWWTEREEEPGLDRPRHYPV